MPPKDGFRFVTSRPFTLRAKLAPNGATETRTCRAGTVSGELLHRRAARRLLQGDRHGPGESP